MDKTPSILELEKHDLLNEGDFTPDNEGVFGKLFHHGLDGEHYYVKVCRTIHDDGTIENKVLSIEPVTYIDDYTDLTLEVVDVYKKH